MTVVGAALTLLDGGPRAGLAATNVVWMGETGAKDPALATETSLIHSRWTSIVIHHSGMPAGDAETLHRLHLAHGYQGLGYHFLLGNGSGLEDGAVQMGYRWNSQLPGAHALGDRADHFNQHAIAICLIGNGDRRPFSDQQIRQLVRLVRTLQREFSIPASAVMLHRDLSSQTTSPGRYFPAAQLREQLLH